jgi:hypothetical protein
MLVKLDLANAFDRVRVEFPFCCDAQDGILPTFSSLD